MAPAALAIIPPPDPGRPRRAATRGTPRPVAPGESGTGISKSQLINLAKAARLAFDAGRAEGRIAKTVKFDDWRHATMDEVVGKVSFHHLTQRDYMPLLAWWQERSGDPVKAMQTVLKADSNPLRIAQHQLEKELKKAKLPPAYVAAICQRQYKCHLSEASVKQLWQLIYTLRNRAAAKAKKAAGALPPPPVPDEPREEEDPF